MVNFNNNISNTPPHTHSPPPTTKDQKTTSGANTAFSKKTVSKTVSINNSQFYKPQEIKNPTSRPLVMPTWTIKTPIPNVFFNALSQPIELSSLKGQVKKIDLTALKGVSEINNLALSRLGLTQKEIDVVNEDLLSPEQLHQLLHYYANILNNYTVINDQLISHNNINTKLSPSTLLKTIKTAIMNLDKSDAGTVSVEYHRFIWQKDPSNKDQLLFHLLDTSKKLGAGTFGQVYSFIHLNTGTEDVAKVAMAEYEKDILNEADIYMHLYKNASPNAEIEGVAAPPISYLDIENTRKALLLKMYDGGSLNDFMKTDAFTKLTYKEKLTGALSLLRGLRFLHVNKLVLHGDIKNRNILVNREPLKFCLADFGGSINLSDGSVLEKITSKKGKIPTTVTLSHVAMDDTEGISSARKDKDHELWYDIQLKRDIYAMGIVIFEMLTGKHPYNSLPAKKGQPAADVTVLSHEVPLAVQEQIKKMLEPDHLNREGSVEHIIAVFEKELNHMI